MRLIDADALLINAEQYRCGRNEYSRMVDVWHIENAPTIDAEPLKHGRWKGHEDDDDLQCPFCGAEFDNIANDILDDWNYCPYCGEMVDLEGE